jgi:hypothetical protein
VAFTLTRTDDPLLPPIYGLTGIAGAAVVLLGLLVFERFFAAEPVMFGAR